MRELNETELGAVCGGRNSVRISHVSQKNSAVTASDVLPWIIGAPVVATSAPTPRPVTTRISPNVVVVVVSAVIPMPTENQK